MGYLELHTDPRRRLPGHHVEVERGEHLHAPGLNLHDYVQILRRRWRLIVAFGLGATFLMGVACLFVQRLYTATAVLHIDLAAPEVTSIQQVAAPGYLQSVEFFQDQVKILASRRLAATVIQSLRLDNDPRFTEDERPGVISRLLDSLWGVYDALQRKTSELLHGSIATQSGSGGGGIDKRYALDVPSWLIGKYQRQIEITPVTNSRLIQLRFTSPSPALAQEVANAHASEYIRQGLRARFELTGEARKFLEAEIERVQGELTQAEEALGAFRRQHRVVSLDDKETAVVDRLNDLSRRLTDAQAARITAEADFRLVHNRDADSLPAIIGNGLVQSLKGEVSRLEIQQANLSAVFLPQSPQLQEVNSQLKQARAHLGTEIKRAAEGVESVYLAAKAREDALHEEFEREQQLVLDQKDISGQYIRLEQAVTANRNLYGVLLTRKQETDVVKGVQISNVTVMDPADRPGGPSRPQVVFDLSFALIFGLGLGVMLCFVLESLDTSFRTPADVRRVLNLPTLGVVPDFATLPARSLPHSERIAVKGAVANPGGEIVSLLHHQSVPAEAYRSIRTSILFFDPQQEPSRVLLVTSSQPGEGKTATAVNLGISLAQLSGRVIVIDADLRQPRCHQALGLAPAHGLAEVLRGQAQLSEVIQQIRLDTGEVTVGDWDSDTGPTLHFLQSGGSPRDPSELLASRRMREVLKILAEQYDTVLVDSPPIFPVTDAAVLAPIVDSVVLVVRGEHTARQVTREAIERLRFMNAKVIGVVLNGVDPRHSEYYRYGSYFGATHVA